MIDSNRDEVVKNVLGDLDELSRHDLEVMRLVRLALNNEHHHPALADMTGWKPHDVPAEARELVERLSEIVAKRRDPTS